MQTHTQILNGVKLRPPLKNATSLTRYYTILENSVEPLQS